MFELIKFDMSNLRPMKKDWVAHMGISIRSV